MTIIPMLQRPRIDGYREYLNDEADALCAGESVAVLDTHTSTYFLGRVYSITGEYVNVELARTKAIIPLDLDQPDMWGDDDHRARKSPTSDDGQFVLVTNAAAPEPSPLFNAMKASVELLALRKQVRSLTKRVKELETSYSMLADEIQSRPTWDQVEARVSEIQHDCHEAIRALTRSEAA